jgi:hypothetical protein
MRKSSIAAVLALALFACSGPGRDGGAAAPEGARVSKDQQQRLRGKVERVRAALQERKRSGPPPAAIYAEMQKVKPLLDAGRIDEAEAIVDGALAQLEGGAAAPAPRALPGPADHALLAMIPASPDGNPSLVPSAFEASRRLGAELLYWYLSWADATERGAEFVVPALGAGGRVAINFGLVRTTVPGKLPKPWKSFDEPGFAEAFAKFAGEFAARHRPDYVFVGNEANTYLRSHPEQVAAYEEIVRRTRDAVHAAAPGVRVGVVVSYRDADRHGQWPMIRRLAAAADLVGYTVYGYADPDFQFGDPRDGLAWLERVPSALPGTPYAIVETGWNSADVLGSSEAEQAEFARLFFRHLATTRAEFVTWFLYQDGKDCSRTARGFLGRGMNPSNERFEIFKAFLCNFGLRRSDGTPKPAWQVFESRG